MCGLYGAMGRHKNRAEAVKILGLLNLARGTDSTGIALISGRYYHIHKKAVKSTEFCNEDTFKKLVSIPESTIIMGHTRLKTHGANTDENAHPFHIGTTIGAHNGIVSNEYEIKRYLEKETPPSYEVDSQYLIHLLDRQRRTFYPARGSLTCTYVHLDQQSKSKNVLYLCQAGNELHIAESKDRKCMFYSSDANHLRRMLSILKLEGDFEVKYIQQGKRLICTYENNYIKYLVRSVHDYKESYYGVNRSGRFASTYNQYEYLS